jgi:D-amino-acid dehydrogenase
MFRVDSPLLINPAPSWHKYSWFAEFIGNIGRYRSNTAKTAKLAILARTALFRIAEEEKIEFGLQKRGILHLYDDRAGFDHALEVNALLAQGGLHRKPVTPDEIVAIEPTLTRAYYGGMYTVDDATGDIHRFTQGLAQACRNRGVTFLQESVVQDIVPSSNDVTIRFGGELPGSSGTEQLSVSGAVVCAGVGSRALAARLGDRVNIYPVKGYSITVNLRDNDSRDAAPWVSLLDDKAKIVTSRLDATRYRVAGTAEFNGYNLDIRADRIAPLISWVRREFPDVATSSVIPWAGLRPMMPNMMPHVASSARPRILYNTGHGHLGWTLAAATAELTVANIATQIPPS